jgi:hypothetical protein
MIVEILWGMQTLSTKPLPLAFGSHHLLKGLTRLLPHPKMTQRSWMAEGVGHFCHRDAGLRGDGRWLDLCGLDDAVPQCL